MWGTQETPTLHTVLQSQPSEGMWAHHRGTWESRHRFSLKGRPIRRQQVLCHQQDLGFTVPHSALRRRSSWGRGLTLTFLCRSWVKGCVSAETGVVSQTVNGTHSLNTVFFCLPPGAWASFSMLP